MNVRFDYLRASCMSLLVAVAGLALSHGLIASQEQTSLLWSFVAESPIDFYEITPLGTVVVSSDDRTVAIDPGSGEELWSSRELRDCRPGFRRKGLLGREATGENVCRIGEGDDFEVDLSPDLPFLMLGGPDGFAVYDLGTGEALWNSEVVGFHPAEEGGWTIRREIGQVLFRNDPTDGDSLRIAAVDLGDGAVQWIVALPVVEEIAGYAGPDVHFFQGKLESDDRYIAALRTEDGAVTFQSVDMRNPIVDDIETLGTILARYFWGKTDSGDWNLVAVDARDGSKLFESAELAEVLGDHEPRAVTPGLTALLNAPGLDLQDLLDSPLEIVYTNGKELTAFERQSGAIRWQIEDLDADRWLNDGEGYLYAIREDDLSSLDVEDGTVRWSRETEAEDWLRLTDHGLIVGCGFSLCVDRIQLLDPATGEDVWPGTIELDAPARDILWAEDEILMLRSNGLTRVNLVDGRAELLGLFELKGEDVPTALREAENGFTVLSNQNVVGLDRQGNVLFHEYYPAPGLSTGDQLLRIAGAAVATGLSYQQAARRASYVQDPVARMLNLSPGASGTLDGSVGYSVYSADLDERLSATRAAEKFFYLYTEAEDGFSLVRFDSDRGVEGGRAWLQEREPEFKLDPAGEYVFLKKDRRTIEAHRFRE